MKRKTITVALISGLLVLLAFGRVMQGTSSAQDGPATSHLIVGAWLISDDSGIWPTSSVLMTFHEDGTALATTEDGITAHGAWQPTGERTADLNLLGFGFGGVPGDLARFLLTVEVSADGQTWTRATTIAGSDAMVATRITPEGARFSAHASPSPERGD